MKDIIPAILTISLMISVFLFGYFVDPFKEDHAVARKPNKN